MANEKDNGTNLRMIPKKSSRIGHVAGRRKSQAQDIIELPGFMKNVLTLRRKWDIPSNGFRSPELANGFNQTLRQEDGVKFQNDITVLLDKHGLQPRWVDGIRVYILMDELVGGFLLPTVSHSINSKDQITDLHIKLNKDTTLKDVEAVWSMVEMIQKDMVGRFDKNYRPKLSKNRDRDMKIMELHENNKTYAEIADVMELAYADVSTIIRNYKRRQA